MKAVSFGSYIYPTILCVTRCWVTAGRCTASGLVRNGLRGCCRRARMNRCAFGTWGPEIALQFFADYKGIVEKFFFATGIAVAKSLSLVEWTAQCGYGILMRKCCSHSKCREEELALRSALERAPGIPLHCRNFRAVRPKKSQIRRHKKCSSVEYRGKLRLLWHLLIHRSVIVEEGMLLVLHKQRPKRSMCPEIWHARHGKMRAPTRLSAPVLQPQRQRRYRAHGARVPRAISIGARKRVQLQTWNVSHIRPRHWLMALRWMPLHGAYLLR